MLTSALHLEQHYREDARAGARAERLYSELDHLTDLRRKAREALVAECRRHPASKVLLMVPTLGVVRSRSSSRLSSPRTASV